MSIPLTISLSTSRPPSLPVSRQVVVASAASLARAPTPPLNMIATGISSSTVQLTWSPPASGSPVDHYVISARTSAENFYRMRMVVSGDLTSATADVFQDLGIPSGNSLLCFDRRR